MTSGLNLRLAGSLPRPYCPYRILWLEAIKNIRIGVRLEQIGNKTQVAFEECHAPPGSLNIEILKR